MEVYFSTTDGKMGRINGEILSTSAKTHSKKPPPKHPVPMNRDWITASKAGIHAFLCRDEDKAWKTGPSGA
jgi:hypothetical protein